MKNLLGGLSVSGTSRILCYGGNQIRSPTAGAKNHWVEPGYHEKGISHIAFNISRLSTKQKLIELQKEFQCFKRNILGLIEIRRKAEKCVTLKSLHLPHYGAEEDKT